MNTSKNSIRVIAFASLIGTTIEWYDFFLYNTAAALVFNKLFFPTIDPIAGTMAAFGTYTVGFVARPFGGIVIGHFGDKVGRKSMLVLTLLIMGVSTCLIGLLPTYETIGPWAAVLLVILRMAQGFGVGGEWGGAVLMAVEHAPPGKRGFYGSWPQIGVPAGLLLSTIGEPDARRRFPDQPPNYFPRPDGVFVPQQTFDQVAYEVLGVVGLALLLAVLAVAARDSLRSALRWPRGEPRARGVPGGALAGVARGGDRGLRALRGHANGRPLLAHARSHRRPRGPRDLPGSHGSTEDGMTRARRSRLSIVHAIARLNVGGQRCM